jgi:3-hydroxybutyrate dehydrogenase
MAVVSKSRWTAGSAAPGSNFTCRSSSLEQSVIWPVARFTRPAAIATKENAMQTTSVKNSAMQPGSSELAGRSAIVTGSTSGIGLGIAQAFAAAGMNVMLNGFGNRAEIERLRGDLAETYGVQVVYSPADMSKPAEIEGMVADARKLFDQVDILVNNAGIQHVEAIETFPPEKWDAIIAINLSSAFHATRAVVAEMKARKWGRIINVASAHGLVASPFKSAYVAAKHGIVGFTKTIALETAEFGITVNAVCPGYVLTHWCRNRSPRPPGPAASPRSR